MTVPRCGGWKTACLCCAGLSAAAIWYVRVLEQAAHGPGVRSFDIYQYYVPNMLYAVRSLTHGARGFLWNAYANCGQPFLGISSTGALYPANLLFLWLPPQKALLGVMVFNFVVAGIGAYALGRVLGLGTAGALAGALVFEFGNGTVDLSTWGPQMSGPYVWLPAAMCFCERILRRPRARYGVGLGVCCALALLPGFPQVVLFTYQLVTLRVAWALVTGEVARPGAVVRTAVFGLVLGPLLAAGTLIPGIESAALSVRNASLTVAELNPMGFLDFGRLRFQLIWGAEIVNPITLIPLVLACASVCRPRRHRVALFYVGAGVLYLALAFGPNGGLFPLYARLPMARLFREPARFTWITSLCIAVLAGLGTDAVAGHRTGPRRFACSLPALAIGVGLFCWLRGTGLVAREWWMVGGVAVAWVMSVFPRGRALAGAAIAATLVFELVLSRRIPFRHLLPDAEVLRTHVGLLARVRRHMTAQDRVYVVPDHDNYALVLKAPQLVGIPTIHDYEPQPTRRYAEYFVLMRRGRPFTDLNSFYYPESYASSGLNRRLLDLTGARYVLAALPPERTPGLAGLPVAPIATEDGVRVYENTTALPRAFVVSSLVVVQPPEALLSRLAFGKDDLRRTALVEAPPASAYLGTLSARGEGEVRFLIDRPEHLRLRVTAGAAAFLFLADQYYPGWRATVNGVAADILRADYLFRAVQVPAGESVVDFRYTPMSVRIGAAVSGLTVLALAIGLQTVRRRARRSR